MTKPTTTVSETAAPRISVALTIAGSDSGGGAGIQADLKTFHTFGVFGTTAITAVTAQNTVGVSAIHSIPPKLVQAQIEAVVSDLRPGAIKSGMLGNADTVQAVAESVRDSFPGPASIPDPIPYVLDPVMVATSGDLLLEPEARALIVSELLPLATLVTPNLPEAEILTGETITDLDGMKRAARALVEQGAQAALVKGGHRVEDGTAGKSVADVFWDGEGEQIWRQEWIETRRTHGTGCTLSAAITAGLALGQDLRTATERAIIYVHRAMRSAPRMHPGSGAESGSGHGPLNHWVTPRSDPLD